MIHTKQSGCKNYFKKKLVTLLILLCGISYPGYNQDIKYIKNKILADSAFKSNDFITACKYYKKVVKSKYSKRTDNFYLAVSFAKRNNEKKAIKQLKVSISKGIYFPDTNSISTNEYLNLFKEYEQYDEIIHKIKQNSYNKLKVIEIDSTNVLFYEFMRRKTLDQKYRKLIKKKPYHMNKHKMDSISQLQKIIDIKNQLWLDSLLKVKGWGYIKSFGVLGIKTSWLIVQHADNDVKFQKKILKSMESEIVDNSQMRSNFAYLTDRVLINSNKEQLYGTQFSLEYDENGDVIGITPKPIRYPQYVDYFRKYIGISTLEKYLNSSLNYMKKSTNK